MSSLIYKLGVSPKLAFHDVFSIDDPDLLAFVPRPAYALLLVFPVSETYERFRREEDGPIDEYQGSGPNEDVLWFKQTIRNACGLIGLLHGVTNGEARKFIGKGERKEKKRKTKELFPILCWKERGRVSNETDK